MLDFAVDEAKRDSSKRVARIFGSVHDPTQKTLGLGLYKNLTKLLESGDLKVSTHEGLALQRPITDDTLRCVA